MALDMTAPDLFLEAHKAAERHLENCWAWLAWTENGEEGEPPLEEDPAFEPFDGCMTCEIREALMAAMPMLQAALILEAIADT